MPSSILNRKTVEAVTGWSLVLLLPFVAAVGWLAGGRGHLHDVDGQPLGIVALELAAFTARGAAGVLRDWSDAGVLDEAWRALRWDWFFIPLYVGCLWLACRGVAGHLASGGVGARWPRVARWLAWGSLLAGALDAVENLSLGQLLRDMGASTGVAWLAAVCAVVKFALVLGTLGFLGVASVRLGWHRGLGEALKPVWFHAVLLVVLWVAFGQVAQGQDVVRSLGEAHAGAGVMEGWRRAFAFLAACTVWATTTWYWSRVLLTFDFREPGEAPPHPSAAVFCVWVPRVLGLGAFWVCTAVLAKAAEYEGLPEVAAWQVRLRLLALVTALLGAGFLAAVTYRRTVAHHLRARRRARSGGAESASGEAGPEAARAAQRPGGVPVQEFQELLSLPVQTRLALGAGALFGLALVVGFAVEPVGLGARLGAPATTLLAASFWVPLASVALYLGHKYRLPVLAMVAVVAAIASLWNDNHAVRESKEQMPVARETVGERLKRWHERLDSDPRYQGEHQHPLYIVATEGGGIRAAYWTASVLGRLRDDPEQGDAFADHLFAISSVSGGSLGAGVYAAQRAEGTPRGAFVPQVRSVLGGDFLAPVLGALLFSDMAQRLSLLPGGFMPDRAAALEHSWERAWPDEDGPFARDFLELWREPGVSGPPYTALDVPALFLNATRVESGSRIVTSNVRITPGVFPDAQDTLDWGELRIPLSTAVHLSARFAYVSPAATFERGHVVDGGYFENSGAVTAQDVLAEVLAHEGTWGTHSITPVLLVITNGTFADASRSDFLSGLSSPGTALLETRGARGINAEAALARDARGHRPPLPCVALRLREEGVPLPLGWMLSELAQDEIDRQARRVSFRNGLPDCGFKSCECERTRVSSGAVVPVSTDTGD